MPVYSNYASSAIVVSTNASVIKMLQVIYSGSASCYLHIFDASALPLASSRPSLSVPLQQAQNGLLIQDVLPLEFSRGICWAISYSPDAFVPAPSESAWVYLTYICAYDLNTRPLVVQADGRLARWPFFRMPPGANPSLPNLTYTCASANRTVQTADDLVVEGVGVDALPIGRTLSSSLLGLAFDGAVINTIVNQIGGSGWTNTVTVTPDIGPGGGACFALEDTAAVYQTSTRAATLSSGSTLVSLWIKHISGVPAEPVFIATPYEILLQQASPSANWTRYTVFLTLSGAKTAVTWYPQAVAANVGKQVIYNPLIVSGAIPSEYYNGSRSAAAITVPSSSLLTDTGQLRFEMAFYPRTINTTFNSDQVFIHKHADAGNRIVFAGLNNGKQRFRVASGATPTVDGGYSTSWAGPIYAPSGGNIGQVMASQSLIKLYFECGGATGNNRIWQQTDSGACVLVHETAATPAFQAGNYYIGHYPGAAVLPAHIVDMASYKTGERPSWIEWADTNILTEWNFTALNAGANAAPASLIYTCASANRTVQTADDLVAESIGVDALPVGRLLSSVSLGLVLDGPITNIVSGQPGGAGWFADTATIAAKTGPFAGALGITDASTSAFGYVSTIASASTLSSGTYCTQIWQKKYSGDLSHGMIVFPGVFAEAVYAQANWRRVVIFTVNSVSATTTALYYPARGITYPLTNAVAVGENGICGWSTTKTAIPSEYYNGSRLGAIMGVAAAKSVSAGRIGMELVFYPRVASTGYGTCFLWRQDANNFATYNGATGRISVTIAGVAWSPTETLTWAAPTYVNNVLTVQPEVKIWVEAGGGLLTSRAKASVNGVLVSFTNSVSPQESLSFAGNIGLLSNLSDATTGQLVGHITYIGLYNYNKRPAWVV